MDPSRFRQSAQNGIYKWQKELTGLAGFESFLGVIMCMCSIILVIMLHDKTIAKYYLSGIIGIFAGLLAIFGGVAGTNGFRIKNRQYVDGHFALNKFLLFLDVGVIIASSIFFGDFWGKYTIFVDYSGRSGTGNIYIPKGEILAVASINTIATVIHLVCALVTSMFACHAWCNPQSAGTNRPCPNVASSSGQPYPIQPSVQPNPQPYWNQQSNPQPNWNPSSQSNPPPYWNQSVQSIPVQMPMTPMNQPPTPISPSFSAAQSPAPTPVYFLCTEKPNVPFQMMALTPVGAPIGNQAGSSQSTPVVVPQEQAGMTPGAQFMHASAPPPPTYAETMNQ